jgi:hypothetical protein
MWIRPALLDLTYCTNIHSGESWSEVRANVENYALALKDLLSPQGPFGIGLRLSAAAAEELLHADRLDEFKTFLDSHGLYVAVLNGFPFGSFNSGIVKSQVFAPDWLQPARVAYTLNLIGILQQLLPQNIDGGISTMPLSYKPWMNRAGSESNNWQQIVGNLVQVVEALVRVRRETGKTIHIDIEPEPDGLVERSDELIGFFEGPLTRIGVPLLANTLGISEPESRRHILNHLRVCFDTCHLSVEFEDPIHSLKILGEHGIGVGRIQISSALHVSFGKAPEVRERILSQLRSFAESVYLHQVIERSAGGSLRNYSDLTNALASPQRSTAEEWRIHYHVPLFIDKYGLLSSNQQANREVLSAVMNSGITSHLEIETYTWDVLPAPLKLDILSSIAREYQWVLSEVGFSSSKSDVALLQWDSVLNA